MTIQEPTLHSSSRDRVRAHRARMRAAGLRPVTYWLPDMKSAAFREQIEKGVVALKRDAEERDVMAWINSIHEENEASGFYGAAADYNE